MPANGPGADMIPADVVSVSSACGVTSGDPVTYYTITFWLAAGLGKHMGQTCAYSEMWSLIDTMVNLHTHH